MFIFLYLDLELLASWLLKFTIHWTRASEPRSAGLFFVSMFPNFVQDTNLNCVQNIRVLLHNRPLQMSSEMFTCSSGRTGNSMYYFQDCEHFSASSSIRNSKIRWSTAHVCISFTLPRIHPRSGQSRLIINQRSLIEAQTVVSQCLHPVHASNSSFLERCSRYPSATRA